MKSVGEAMSIGRSFAEALGKAMRSTETPQVGFWTGPVQPEATAEELVEQLQLARAPAEPAAGLAQVVGGVVADLLEPGQQRQDEPAAGVLVGLLDLLCAGFLHIVRQSRPSQANVGCVCATSLTSPLSESSSSSSMAFSALPLPFSIGASTGASLTLFSAMFWSWIELLMFAVFCEVGVVVGVFCGMRAVSRGKSRRL